MQHDRCTEQEVQHQPQTVNWLKIRGGNYDEAHSKQGRKEKVRQQEEVPKMLCVVWSEISKENENKGLLLFSLPLFRNCLSQLSTVLSKLAHFSGRNTKLPSKKNHWPTSCGVGINRNEVAVQWERLFSQHTSRFFAS